MGGRPYGRAMHRAPRLFLAALAPLMAAGARQGPARAEPLLVQYEVRAAGLQVMLVEATLQLDGPSYAVKTRIRTTGVAAMFSASDQVTLAEGRWRGATPLPAHYRVAGGRRGSRRD